MWHLKCSRRGSGKNAKRMRKGALVLLERIKGKATDDQDLLTAKRKGEAECAQKSCDRSRGHKRKTREHADPASQTRARSHKFHQFCRSQSPTTRMWQRLYQLQGHQKDTELCIYLETRSQAHLACGSLSLKDIQKTQWMKLFPQAPERAGVLFTARSEVPSSCQSHWNQLR